MNNKNKNTIDGLKDIETLNITVDGLKPLKIVDDGSIVINYIMINKEIWLLGKDVAYYLCYVDTSNAIRNNCPNHKLIRILSLGHTFSFINLEDFKNICIKCTKIHKEQSILFHDLVIEKINNVFNKKYDYLDLSFNEYIDDKDTKKLDDDEEKDCNNNDFSLTKVIEVLSIVDTLDEFIMKLSENKEFSFLLIPEERKLLLDLLRIKCIFNENNLPKRKYIKKKYFYYAESIKEISLGKTKNTYTIYITEKGKLFLINFIRKYIFLTKIEEGDK